MFIVNKKDTIAISLRKLKNFFRCFYQLHIFIEHFQWENTYSKLIEKYQNKVFVLLTLQQTYFEQIFTNRLVGFFGGQQVYFFGGWNIFVHYAVFTPFPGYCESLANVPARVDKTSSQNICSKRRTKLPRRIEDYEGFRQVCF